MAERNNCPECGAKALYESGFVNANGASGDGPTLLPGLGGLLQPARMSMIVCKKCGLTRLYAEQRAVDLLGNPGTGWLPI
jgi:predicted nucleic-acid-binding Zn-ribbon protein